jgi:hypothetical protein
MIMKTLFAKNKVRKIRSGLYPDPLHVTKQPTIGKTIPAVFGGRWEIYE